MHSAKAPRYETTGPRSAERQLEEGQAPRAVPPESIGNQNEYISCPPVAVQRPLLRSDEAGHW